MSEITRILQQAATDRAQASDRLLPLVYEELRRLATAKLAQERPGQTLQATALVHEAYLRLVGNAMDGPENQEADPQWNGRGHFFAAAAEAMRRILVDHARRKQSQKHGGDFQRQTLGDPDAPQSDQELLDLDEALSKLCEEDRTAARVVEMRYFAGMGHEEIACALDITVYRARQKWTYARAWLRRELG